MFDVLINRLRPHIDKLLRLNKTVKLSKWLQSGNFSFLVDLPANSLWQTLCDEFPEAKVVLVVRDEDRWIKSLLNHIDVRLNIA